ncbi:MFS general substrate transporter [Clathrospora elynae]|uniref:MFS general substrate transporter n=1 Tax=Clathrospora elynae TaxID=706981 RepID=A0A6A5SBN8_9PLEO|nr:MFS general substrate transporter [Clathrospora elynae]
MPPSPTNHDRTAIETSEATPLLSDAEAVPLALPVDQSHPLGDVVDGSEDADEEEGNPLPRTQILLLCYTSCMSPIAFFSIFPYINFMIEKVGNVDKEDVGFYSGLIESLFSLTQMCVMIFWGKASDRFGRKPVLVTSLLGLAVATTLFGMSQSLWQMVLFRCLAGIFAGTIVTVRTMLSENSTKHTQARAFSLFAFFSNMGIFIGPLIGGALERPAEKYTSTFGKAQFWHDYPYVLPNIFTSAIALSAAITTMLFVKETLHIHRDNNKKKAAKPIMSAWELANYPGVLKVLVIYNYIMFLAFMFTAVFPVAQYTPVALGGLGFSPGLIAACTALNGVSQASWLLIVFPVLHKRIGTGRILWWCGILWPVLFAIAPLCNLILRYELTAFFWSTMPIVLVLGSGAAMTFTGMQLAVNDISPSHESLGTLNAIALAANSGTRAVAPALATSIYAIGVKYRILGGQLFWVLQVILALGFFVLLKILPEKARGDVKRHQDGRT